MTLMSASVQRLGPLGKVSKTSGGGRPRSEDGYGKFEMEDIEAIDSVPGTQRAKALALDLWWTALGHRPRVRIPAHVDLSPSRRAELTRRADALSAGGMASDLAWADAMVKAMPSRGFSDVGWLKRNRRYKEAAVEEFHNDLETMVQFVRRRRRRTDQVLNARAAKLVAAIDRRSSQPPPARP